MTKVYIADIAPLEDKKRYQMFYQTLPAHRQDKIDQMKQESDKRRAMGAWLLLRQALWEVGIKDKKIELVYGEDKKPYIKEPQGIFFNLSHSGNKVMCAVSDGEVGCDVEKIAEVRMNVARRFFHPAEYEDLLQIQSEEERQDKFYRLWTLKESFLKVTGLGMKLALNSFQIILQGNAVTMKQQEEVSLSYYFKEYNLQDGYKYACCSLKPDFEEAIKTVKFCEW